MTTVLCIPQWQGSAAGRAPLLAAGARRTAELVPAAARVTVPVLDADGPIAAGVRALDVLLEHRRLTRAALAAVDDVVLTAGGDCGVELAPIAAARARHGGRLTVLWIDAHPDVSTPQSLPSGSFHAMVLRTLLGDGAAPLVPAEPLGPEQVILTGVRSFEPGQREYLARAGIRQHGVAELERALDGLTGPVYVHVDLDVLDPAEFASTGYPEPGGPSVQRVVDLISGVEDVVGASITEHAPAAGGGDPAEAAAIRRIGAALCRDD
jgi:arginase